MDEEREEVEVEGKRKELQKRRVWRTKEGLKRRMEEREMGERQRNISVQYSHLLKLVHPVLLHSRLQQRKHTTVKPTLLPLHRVTSEHYSMSEYIATWWHRYWISTPDPRPSCGGWVANLHNYNLYNFFSKAILTSPQIL